MGMYACEWCGYEYRSEIGDTERGIEAGTEFEELPSDWSCPLCGASKDDFELIAENEEDDDLSE